MAEHDEQSAIIEWAKWNAAQYPELDMLYATINQGKRSYGAARYYQKEGMRSGIPDLCLPVARKNYHGLYIELKHRNANGQIKVSENQHWWLEHLREQGYRAVIRIDFDGAVEEIKDYLGISE